MDSMILGRYIPGDSIVHRLDPRSKLMAMMLLILIVFWANNPLTNLILFIATGIFIALSGVSISFFIQGLKSMFFLIAFTTIFQLFFISNGNVLFEFSFVRITDYALQQAGIIFCRFVLIIFFSTLLTLTTMPLSLASAVEALLAPLKSMKVPVHEIGLMLSMSLRFVPTLMDDVAEYANQVYVMEKGRLVKSGKPCDVFQDVVFMEEVQLGVPKITAFCKRLADRGVSFKRLPIKIEEFKESLNG